MSRFRALVRIHPILIVAAAVILCGGWAVGAITLQSQPGGDALPPIVFVSRTHISTLNNYDVGPPIEVIGREMTVGGTLRLLKPGGSVVDLAGPHNGLFDVQRPMVSFDGTRVVFSGVRTRNGMWRIFEVRLDGTGLRQVTPEERGLDIPDDPSRPRQNQSTFGRYGDFSPAYLPDGRIVFSSSRYPSTSGSCGQRALNLYVIDSNGANLHRILTTRSGAIDPFVLANGRIIFGLWFDNMNMPALGTEGLQPLETDANFQPSFFEPWSLNPDGTGAGRLGYMGGFLTHNGGGLHYREMPDGSIVYTRRATASLLGSTLATAIAKFRPGDGSNNTTEGIGDAANLDAPHALAPTPLPDGSILFSHTPSARTWRDAQHRLFAEFDYGLYVCDGDFTNLRLVYDNPGTEELDAVAVYPRTAAAIPDKVHYVLPEDPTAPAPGVAVMQSRTIYADLDRRFTNALAPLPGSVVAVDVYDDAQTFYTTPQFPLVRKQMPRFVGSFPVAEDGSFRAEIPADKPVIFVLRTHTGVAARHPGSLGEIRTPFFGHELTKAGDVLQCAGCHRGHMIRPELNRAAQVNLARLASAVGSSTRDAGYMAAARVADGNIGLENGRYQWVPAETDPWPWVRLVWEQRITARQLVVYPRPGAPRPIGELEIYLSNGRRVTAQSDPVKPDEPITVALPDAGPVSWAHVQLLGHPDGGAPGVAEITVHGDPFTLGGALAPAPPPSVTLTAGNLRLSWTRSPSRSVVGYKIFAGTSPDYLPIEWDVGNVTSFQPEHLAPHQKYWFQLKAYDGRRFGPAYARELSGTAVPLRIDRITPASGPTWGETEVTIEGADFVSGVVVKIGGEYVRNLKFVSSTKLTGVTYRQAAGVYDVLVRNPGKMEAVLPRAFRHE